ncbi:MAG: cation:proton antiporter [Gammaproteobacteria bacterium]
MRLSELLFTILGFLTLAMIMAGSGQRLRLPYTVLLVLAGLAINVLAPSSPFTESIQEFHLTHDLVLFVFLPALIFESALSLDARALMKNLVPVLIMAIPGMLVSGLLVALGLVMSLDISPLVALLFGALISATDPVAVIALFHELGAPRRLTVLVEGESLFNDATAIVLFNILLGFVLSGQFDPAESLSAIGEFIRIFFGGTLLGCIFGILMSELIVRLGQSERSVTIVLTLIMAYFSFIIAEEGFHISGVMSTLSAAICLTIFGLPRLGGETEHGIRETWNVMVLIFNSLLFIMIGLSVHVSSLASYWQAILWAALAVAIARAVSVYGLIPMTTCCFRLPQIPLASRHIMWWGGLKGGLAIAVVLSIPDSVADKQLLIELTLGVVLISLLLNASTVRPLIRRLKIDRLSDEEWLELQQGMEQIKVAVEDVLQNFSRLHLLDSDMQSSVVSALQQKLPARNIELSEDELLKQIHLHAVQAEEEELAKLHNIGLVNYYTFLNFKDILLKDKAKTVPELIVATNVTAITNPFLRFEMAVIKFLSEYDWSLGLLMKYQSSRFSNLIRHDIAGVLMAHKALVALKHAEQTMGGEKLEIIKQVYRDRFQRRQGRLRKLGAVFPDFYHQYECRLFQEVALLYSLKLLANEHEHGKLSTKVFKRLELRLNDALKQLPHITANLSLANRDNWLDSVPLFSGLSQHVLQKLAKNAHYISFLPGDTVFNEGDKGDSVYVLVSGTANVFQWDSQGSSIHIAELRPGSFIGEHALSERAVRTATVRAKTYITLLRLTTDEVVELSKDAPELAARLKDAEFGKYG